MYIRRQEDYIHFFKERGNVCLLTENVTFLINNIKNVSAVSHKIQLLFYLRNNESRWTSYIVMEIWGSIQKIVLARTNNVVSNERD